MEDNAYNRQISKEILDMNKKYINHLNKVGRGISGGMCNCGSAMSGGILDASHIFDNWPKREIHFSGGRKPVRRVKGGVLDNNMVEDMEGGFLGLKPPVSLKWPSGGAKSRKVGGRKKKGGADRETPPPRPPYNAYTASQLPGLLRPPKSQEVQALQRDVVYNMGENSGLPPTHSGTDLSAAPQLGQGRRGRKGKGVEGSGIMDLLTLPFTLPGKIMSLPGKLYSAVTGKAKPRRKAGAITAAAKPKKAASPWIAHVKAFAAKHGMSYRDALRSPQCSASYK